MPMRVMDKLTGTIDHEIVDYWEKYDIRLQVENNWSTLTPRVPNKLHVIGGGWDTFFLNPALEMLKAEEVSSIEKARKRRRPPRLF